MLFCWVWLKENQRVPADRIFYLGLVLFWFVGKSKIMGGWCVYNHTGHPFEKEKRAFVQLCSTACWFSHKIAKHFLLASLSPRKGSLKKKKKLAQPVMSRSHPFDVCTWLKEGIRILQDLLGPVGFLRKPTKTSKNTARQKPPDPKRNPKAIHQTCPQKKQKTKPNTGLNKRPPKPKRGSRFGGTHLETCSHQATDSAPNFW